MRCYTVGGNFLTDGRQRWKQRESSTSVVGSIASVQLVQSHERHRSGGRGDSGTTANVDPPAVLGRKTLTGKVCCVSGSVSVVTVCVLGTYLDSNWHPAALLCLFQARVKLQ